MTQDDRSRHFPHPHPFSRREKGDNPLSLRERVRGREIFKMTLRKMTLAFLKRIGLFAKCTACILALAAVAAPAAYPDKPIRLIMPYPAGGSIDTAGRAVAQRLAENFRQQIVVDNRTGSGGTIGTETGARAVPDGYTLVMGGTGTLSLSPHLQRNLPYDPEIGRAHV